MNPSSSGTGPVPAPTLWQLAGELRAPVEALRLALGWRQIGRMPRGDGHAVLLLPGFGISDAAMRPLCHALRRLGYAAETWELGRNLGMRPALKAALSRRLWDMFERAGQPVSLIGWSLGGVFARELARAHPHQVRCVITLGSPINGSPDANNLMPLFRWVNRGRAQKTDAEGFERRKRAPPVPCYALYSRRDGIVAWRASQENEADNTRNIEVHGTHLGLVFNLEVIHRVAECLAAHSSNFPTDGKKMRLGY